MQSCKQTASLLAPWCWNISGNELSLTTACISETTHEVHPAGGGIAGITPYLLPRDYSTASAAVVQPEIAGPIAPGLTGATVSVGGSKVNLTSTSAANQNAGQVALASTQPLPALPFASERQAAESDGLPPRAVAAVTATPHRPVEFPPMYSVE